MTASLLPPNATPLERALEDTFAGRFAALHPAVIASVWDPDTCPAEALAFLAWQLSIDLWDNAWPETKKREACRNALLLHSRKTTIAGIRDHLTLAGAELRKVIRPPARGFSRAAMTEDQRKAWLDGLPQIRIYPFATRTIARHRGFFTGPGARHQFHGGVGLGAGALLRDTRGAQLLGRRATLYDRGEETPVTLTGAEDGVVTRVLLGRAETRRSWYRAGGHSRRCSLGHGFHKGSLADLQAVTIRAGDDAPLAAVTRGLQPVDVRPQRIAQPRTAPAARAFFGRHGRFLRASHGPLLIYDRYALFDPERLGARRKVLSWNGVGRAGIPAFTAELKVQVPMLRARRRSGRWNGVGFRKRADMTPLANAIEAVRAAKAARDTILIDVATIRPAAFGRGLRFGTFQFGQLVAA